MVAASPITCPSCKKSYPARPASGICDVCSGTLPGDAPPAPPTATLGEPPPPPPRVLPPGYELLITKTHNGERSLGRIFVVIGVLLGLLACGILAGRGDFITSVVALGFGLMWIAFGWVWVRLGLIHAANQIAALQRGVAVEGKVYGLMRNSRRGPIDLLYDYQVDGKKLWGKVSSYAREPADRAGDRAWIVYLADRPKVSSLWPPVE